MAHRRFPFTVFPSLTRGARAALVRAGLLAGLSFLAAAEDDCFGEEEDPPSTECADACAVEAACGFRSEEDCVAKCPADGKSLNKALDDCFAAAANCLESAACSCSAGCARVDECAEGGEQNAECVSSCDTIIEQETQQTYLEQRCRIESSCEDLAACSSVSG